MFIYSCVFIITFIIIYFWLFILRSLNITVKLENSRISMLLLVWLSVSVRFVCAYCKEQSKKKKKKNCKCCIFFFFQVRILRRLYNLKFLSEVVALVCACACASVCLCVLMAVLSCSVCPDLVLMALERKDYFLCQLCLQFFPDIPEAVTCACLKAFIRWDSPVCQLLLLPVSNWL